MSTSNPEQVLCLKLKCILELVRNIIISYKGNKFIYNLVFENVKNLILSHHEILFYKS